MDGWAAGAEDFWLIFTLLIAANRWYLFADPLATPVYVYGYLNGAEGPQVTTGPVSGVDGVEVSVIFDFGVGAIDWRGAWYNPGV